MFKQMPSFVFLGSVFIISFLLGLKVVKGTIAWLTQQKFYDQIHKAYCEQLAALHDKKQYVPTGGGLFFMIFLPLMFLALGQQLWPCMGLLLTSVFCWGGLGWYDDRIKLRKQSGHGLTVKQKFLCEFFLATIIGSWVMFLYKSTSGFSYLQIPFWGMCELPTSGWSQGFLMLLAVLATVATVNAVNITDGLDGLAIGSTIPVALGGIVIACLQPISVFAWCVALVLAVIIGAMCSFLWYNCFPAQVFMGDTGALLLGGILSTCFILLRAELYLLIMGGGFVVEALSVILQVISYRLRKKRIFLCAPLHHHYEYQNIHEQKIVIRFWIVSFICVVIGIAGYLLGMHV